MRRLILSTLIAANCWVVGAADSALSGLPAASSLAATNKIYVTTPTSSSATITVLLNSLKALGINDVTASGNNTLTGTNTFTGPVTFDELRVSALVVTNPPVFNLSSSTNLNASELRSGNIPLARGPTDGITTNISFLSGAGITNTMTVSNGWIVAISGGGSAPQSGPVISGQTTNLLSTNSVTVAYGVSSVTITNLAAGRRYYVAAKSTDGTDFSVYSNEDSAKTKLNAPKNLSTTP